MKSDVILLLKICWKMIHTAHPETHWRSTEWAVIKYKKQTKYLYLENSVFSWSSVDPSPPHIWKVGASGAELTPDWWHLHQPCGDSRSFSVFQEGKPATAFNGALKSQAFDYIIWQTFLTHKRGSFISDKRCLFVFFCPQCTKFLVYILRNVFVSLLLQKAPHVTCLCMCPLLRSINALTFEINKWDIGLFFFKSS